MAISTYGRGRPQYHTRPWCCTPRLGKKTAPCGTFPASWGCPNVAMEGDCQSTRSGRPAHGIISKDTEHFTNLARISHASPPNPMAWPVAPQLWFQVFHRSPVQANKPLERDSNLELGFLSDPWELTLGP